MSSCLRGKNLNIGSPQYVTVDELEKTVSKVANKKVRIKHVDGTVGVHARNFTNEKIYSIGWESMFDLEEGIKRTYPWIAGQVKNH